MAVSFALVAARPQGDSIAHADRFFLDTPFVRDFALDVNARIDQPEDASLDWADGIDHGEPISPEDCHPPGEVARGLLWLRELANTDDPQARSFWTRSRLAEPYSSEAFARRMAHDIDGMIAICQQAQERGDLVVGVIGS